MQEEEKTINPLAYKSKSLNLEKNVRFTNGAKGGEQLRLRGLGTPFVKGDTQNFSAWQLAGELGYIIAIPIVILALVGRWVDKALGTSPWLLLAGILVSIIISSFMVYRKTARILK